MSKELGEGEHFIQRKDSLLWNKGRVEKQPIRVFYRRPCAAASLRSASKRPKTFKAIDAVVA